MRIRDTRLWALLIAVAFIVLWCASVGVTCAIPAQEPLAEPITSVTAPEIEAIGICGWAIVGAGTLGVIFTIIIGCRTPKRRRRSRAFGAAKSVSRDARPMYTVRSSPRYQRSIERRF